MNPIVNEMIMRKYQHVYFIRVAGAPDEGNEDDEDSAGSVHIVRSCGSASGHDASDVEDGSNASDGAFPNNTSEEAPGN